MHNMRWLACTVLTGLAGAALMGGALFIAFDRQAEFAIAPHAETLHATAGRGPVEGGRADKLVVPSQRVSNRHVVQETTVRKLGGKEFVQVQPYVRLTASLATTRDEVPENIPEFDANAIFASLGAIAGPDGDEPAETDGAKDALEVSFEPLSGVGGADPTSHVLDVAEIEESLREMFSPGGNALAYAAPSPAVPDDGIFGLDMHTPVTDPETADRTFGGDNVTTVAKRRSADVVRLAEKEVTVEISRGDTLMSILVDHGASRGEAMKIISGHEHASKTLREGQTVRLMMAAAPDDPGRVKPVGIALADEEAEVTTAAEPSSFLRRLASIGGLGLRRASTSAEPVRPMPDAQSSQGPRASVYEAIYETALGHDVPRPLADELIRIFAFDVDFQRSASLGDAIEIFYAETGEESSLQAPEILYAAITQRGETHRFYRFRHPEDGVVDYYDESGKSAKKFLMRKPLSGGTFRSGFGMRRHPILGSTRMHNGVDWAARTGTPVMASGNGTVIKAQWHGGYGRHVLIRHANGYETSYSHLSRIADDVRPGAKVRQGQVIGEVGSTGMSTGPHLHYEVMVNGRNVDPMRIQLPRGRTLEGRELVAFERERERIEALMDRAPTSTRMAAR